MERDGLGRIDAGLGPDPAGPMQLVEFGADFVEIDAAGLSGVA
jgi:hypothetical protein